MTSKSIIVLDGITKTFTLPHERSRKLKDYFLHPGDFRKSEIQDVLQNISLSIDSGECVGIIGSNGSGKSTLLRVISGVFVPQNGNVFVRGTLSPVADLGVGFQSELSGRDNVFLYGAILGLSRSMIIDRYEDIVAFAGLQSFMDQKIKNYSSGMRARLAFAVTTQVDADIFLVDEALAVGDEEFQKKCFAFFVALKKRGKTVILVSHDLTVISHFCDRVYLLDRGKLIGEGSADKVIEQYRSLVGQHGRNLDKTAPILITSFEIYDEKDQVRRNFNRGDFAKVIISYQVNVPVRCPIFQVQITNELGLLCRGDNTLRKGVDMGVVRGEGRISLTYRGLNLLDGHYVVQGRIWPDNFEGECYDEWIKPIPITIESPLEEGGGVCFIDSEWSR